MNNKHQLTERGFEKLELELEELKNVERPKVIELIKEARGQGDLSENADYDAARDEQAKLESRISELENILKNASVIHKTNLDIENLGKVITIKFIGSNAPRNMKLKFTLVSSNIETSTNPESLKLSVDSPIGAACIDAEVGDRLTIKSSTGKEQEFQIVSLENEGDK